jgi:3-methyl-2-oxobutanoate hydroxymethyltransferase
MSVEDSEVTLATLRALKRQGGKFACLTAYDASFTHLLEAAGVDVLLVGDTLGMMVQGHDSTLPVTLADMI